jgi:hypothetical protein
MYTNIYFIYNIKLYINFIYCFLFNSKKQILKHIIYKNLCPKSLEYKDKDFSVSIKS